MKNVDLKVISVHIELIIHTERFTSHILHIIVCEKVKNQGIEKEMYHYAKESAFSSCSHLLVVRGRHI